MVVAKIKAKGKWYKCDHCGSEKFLARQSVVQASIPSPIRPEWVKEMTYCFECEGCSKMHWFFESSKLECFDADKAA